MAAALVLAAGATLVGCSARPGTAATVTYTALDGAERTVTVTEEELGEVAPVFASRASRGEVLQALVNAPVLLEVGEAYDALPAEEDVLGNLRQYDSEAAEFPQEAHEVVRSLLVLELLRGLDVEVQQQAAVDLEALSQSLEVSVSPRYQESPEWIIQQGTAPVELD